MQILKDDFKRSNAMIALATLRLRFSCCVSPAFSFDEKDVFLIRFSSCNEEEQLFLPLHTSLERICLTMRQQRLSQKHDAFLHAAGMERRVIDFHVLLLSCSPKKSGPGVFLHPGASLRPWARQRHRGEAPEPVLAFDLGPLPPSAGGHREIL